jgi:hypothetical protein
MTSRSQNPDGDANADPPSPPQLPAPPIHANREGA